MSMRWMHGSANSFVTCFPYEIVYREDGALVRVARWVRDATRVVAVESSRSRGESSREQQQRHGFDLCILITSFWLTYSKICGASSKMLAVPIVVTAKNRYSCRRSITIATYFQSSRICATRSPSLLKHEPTLSTLHTLTWMYSSSLLRCSAMNSIASVARYASGVRKRASIDSSSFMEAESLV